MKRAATVGAVLAALLWTPAASAGAGGLEITPKQGEVPKLKVRFDLKLKNGKPVRVKDFVFNNVIVACTEGFFTVDNVGNPLPTMKVTKKTKKFSDDFTAQDGAQRVGVSGKVKGRGKRVIGKIRVRGAFTDPATGGPVTNCDSGVQRYRAKRG